MTRQTPVLMSASDEQVTLFTDFVESKRADNVAAAGAEARRLAPLFGALSDQMTQDMQLDPRRAAAVNGLTSPKTLSLLFNVIAARTRNTILSEILVAPEALLSADAAQKDIQQFRGTIKYKGTGFTFGFIQAHGRDGSVSLPVLALNDGMMKSIERFQSHALLTALQAVATAGNHDALHHYTNTGLYDGIAETTLDDGLPRPPVRVEDWMDEYFSDYDESEPDSYESWLMLEYLRLRRILDAGPEGAALAQACDTFFDELSRIGRELADTEGLEAAHTVVDYFGTTLLFMMMRYMPLDDPRILHALERLQEADPDSAAIEADRDDVVWAIQSQRDNTARMLYDYKVQGLDLTDEPSFADVKRMQLILMAPWIARLISPADEKSVLGSIKSEERVGAVGLDMISTAAASVWLDLSDGKHSFIKPDGSHVDVWLKDGRYHREDGPAYRITGKDGTLQRETWYKDGERVNSTAPRPARQRPASALL